MTDWKNSLIATAVGGLSGTAIGLVAFFLLTSRYYPNMGGTLFLAAPVTAGFSIALVSRKGHSWVAAVLLSVICSLILLVALGKEGTLCAILAFPIVGCRNAYRNRNWRARGQAGESCQKSKYYDGSFAPLRAGFDLCQ